MILAIGILRQFQERQIKQKREERANKKRGEEEDAREA
jgi:hypothetical protein